MASILTVIIGGKEESHAAGGWGLYKVGLALIPLQAALSGNKSAAEALRQPASLYAIHKILLHPVEVADVAATHTLEGELCTQILDEHIMMANAYVSFHIPKNIQFGKSNLINLNHAEIQVRDLAIRGILLNENIINNAHTVAKKLEEQEGGKKMLSNVNNLTEEQKWTTAISLLKDIATCIEYTAAAYKILIANIH